MSRTRMLQIAIFVIAFGGAAALEGDLIDARRDAQGARLTRQGGTFFNTFVFGGFRPIYVENLWTLADRLYSEGRYWETVEVFDRIARAEPDNPRVWMYQGRILAFNIASFEVEKNERYRWYRRAIRHVERGIAANPEYWPLYELVYWIYMDHVARHRSLNGQFLRVTGHDGLWWAVYWAGKMREQFPGVYHAWNYEARAGQETVLRLVIEGRLAAAADALDALHGVMRELGTRFDVAADGIGTLLDEIAIERDLARRLVDVVDLRSMTIADQPGLSATLGAFEKQLRLTWADRDLDAGQFDVRFYLRIHQRVMRLCQSLVVSKKHDLALQILPWLRRISELAEGRKETLNPYYSSAYVDLFRDFAVLDLGVVRDLEAGTKPTVLTVAPWRHALASLEEVARERLGRSDLFKRRIEESRR